MKDLRIVIVSWNVGNLLERCLRSLPAACAGLEWEAVVVDNASTDGSVDAARRAGASRHGGTPTGVMNHAPTIKIITNQTNLGFAKACNMGAAGSDARYVLFLNPDTQCHPDSLKRLLAVADAHPKGGIFGPRLVYPDGRAQPSVRRFPGVWDQAAIILKLNHLFPRLPTLRRYYATDLDPEREQSVDQVMGACFLVRRELLDERLGYDERYFIWMEEVDFCKTAKAHGWEVVYIPSVTVIHHLGQSFAKEFRPKRQAYFLASLNAYFAKWHPGWRAWFIRALSPLGMAAVHAVNGLRSPYVKWSLLVLAVETVSALTIFRPLPNSIATAAAGIVVFLLGWKKPTVGLGMLLLELLIGSKGYLLQLGSWPDTISLRMVITGAFLAGWLVNFLQHGKFWDLVALFSTRRGYLLLFMLITFTDLRGILLGNYYAFNDANAWGDWLLLFPVLDVSWRYRDRIRRDLAPVFIVGIFWLAVKTLALEYIFSHGFKLLSQPAYLWVRRTGVGEVTLVVGNAFRIFMQSYVYAVAAWIVAACWWLTRKTDDARSVWKQPAWWMMSASTFILGLSLSRSFWIGAAAGAVAAVLLARHAKFPWWKRLWGPVATKVVGLLGIAAVLAFPIPRVEVASLASLFGSRGDLGEAAAVSRWRLLPVLMKKIGEHPILGSGFGATVTYETRDPRILKDHPDGMYTTYAFEWGWLEHWVKFGILGIPLIAYLLFSLGRRLWRLDEPLWLRMGGVSTLVALATLHIFTPFLNHPLGFLFFFVGEGMILSSHARTERAKATT